MKFTNRHNSFSILFGLLSLITLVVFNPTQNASKGITEINLDVLNSEQEYAINQIYYLEKAQQVDSFMNIAQHVYGFNGNVLIALNGQAVLIESYGSKHPGLDDKLNHETSFQLASITKQFTAIGILLLVQDSLLSLDQALSDIIPELPYPGITIRHLLQHTSGLPNYMFVLEHNWKKESIPGNEDMIALLAKHKYQYYFNPGRRHDYSNTGYAVLASVIERVSTLTYGDFMQKRIFEPLNMNQSYVFDFRYPEQFEERLRGYQKRGRRWIEINPTVHDGIVGDKGIYASVYDLYLWDKGLHQGKLLNQDLLLEAFSPGLIRDRYPFPYGYGFRIRYSDGNKVVYHNGRWEGFRNSFHRNIDSGNTIVLLSNNEFRQVDTMRKKIEKILEDTPVNSDLEIIHTAILHGYAFSKQLYDLKRDENPTYRLNHDLLNESIIYFDSIDKKQLSSILRQLINQS